MSAGAIFPFELIRPDGTLGLEDLREEARQLADQTPVGQVLLIRADGAHPVILGLLSAMTCGRTTYLIRDRRAVPAPNSWPEGQFWQACADPNPAHAGVLWMQTSGTSGRPKWIAQPVERLTAAIAAGQTRATWLLTYEPASFAGVQVILSAIAGGHRLVCPSPNTNPADLVKFAAIHQVSHMSGTPTFWRSFLRASHTSDLHLRHITLGGELADQSTLDELARRFPHVRIRHIYATTEMGVVFSVQDGKAGFPKGWLDHDLPNGIRLNVSPEGTLVISRTDADPALATSGWDSRDVVEVKGERVYFKGRADTLINVGGHKIYPEEVEAHLLALPIISDVCVSAQVSPITGHILTADIVANQDLDEIRAKQQIQAHLQALPRHARPAVLRFKDHLPLGGTGKKARQG